MSGSTTTGAIGIATPRDGLGLDSRRHPLARNSGLPIDSTKRHRHLRTTEFQGSASGLRTRSASARTSRGRLLIARARAAPTRWDFGSEMGDRVRRRPRRRSIRSARSSAIRGASGSRGGIPAPTTINGGNRRRPTDPPSPTERPGRHPPPDEPSMPPSSRISQGHGRTVRFDRRRRYERNSGRAKS